MRRRTQILIAALLAFVALRLPSIVEGQAGVVPHFVSRIIFGAASSGVVIRSSTGSPESAVTAPVGSLFLRSDGASGTSLYTKGSGSGNTGWDAVVGSGVTASSTNTFTNKSYDTEGTGNVFTFVEKRWFSAVCQEGGSWGEGGGASWGTPGTDAPQPSCQNAAPTSFVFATLDFADTATERISYSMPLPSDWAGAIDLKIFWYTTATTGNVVWQISTHCTADNESVDPSGYSFNAAQTITDAAKASSSLLNTATLTGVTTTGCAAGELLHLRVLRDPTHASDTIAATAAFVGIELTYRRAL